VGALDLRTGAILRALYGCVERATTRGRQIIAFSLQTNHLHLIIEAGDRENVTETVRGLASVTARRFNRCLGREGGFWQDRYHRHDLRTPTEIRNAVAYVLHNRRKHLRERGLPDDGGLDAFSSAAWFDGWDERGAAAASWQR
jgi:REP element-mobilizing transposase RayT